VPHQAYNPDRSPSDFFLFGTVKRELQNDENHSREDLILAIKAIFDELSKEALNSFCVSWIKRFE
jgi:hypothetical protein